MGSVLQVAVAAGMAVLLMVGMIFLTLSHSPDVKAQKASRGIALDLSTVDLEQLTGQTLNEKIKE
jgi:hypothetical protein